MHRCKKEPEYPNGRVFAGNTQDKWTLYRDFLKDNTGHELIGSEKNINIYIFKLLLVSLAINVVLKSLSWRKAYGYSCVKLFINEYVYYLTKQVTFRG